MAVQILGEDLRFDTDQASKMATALGAGLSRWGTVCGGVSGGAMALGFSLGPVRGEEKEKREKTYTRVQDMIRAFEKAFRSIQCRELIGFNLLDPGERQKYRQSPLRRQCADYIALVIENVQNALQES